MKNNHRNSGWRENMRCRRGPGKREVEPHLYTMAAIATEKYAVFLTLGQKRF